MSKAGQWGVSTDQDIFHGSHETREAAIEATREYKGVRVWIGQYREPSPPEQLINPMWLIENIQEQDDYNMESVDGWPDCGDEELSDLACQMKLVFAQWLDSYALRPTHLVVDASTMEEILLTNQETEQCATRQETLRI